MNFMSYITINDLNSQTNSDCYLRPFPHSPSHFSYLCSPEKPHRKWYIASTECFQSCYILPMTALQYCPSNRIANKQTKINRYRQNPRRRPITPGYDESVATTATKANPRINVLIPQAMQIFSGPILPAI